MIALFSTIHFIFVSTLVCHIGKSAALLDIKAIHFFPLVSAQLISLYHINTGSIQTKRLLSFFRLLIF